MGIQFDGINNEIKSQTKIDFPGSIGIAGTLTYEDVTNVDSVGIITARTGVIVGSGVTLNATGVIATGVVTATSFSGSGANLTGISAGTSLSGSTNNQVTTVTGANAIQGESNLTFDGTNLSVTGNVSLPDHVGPDYIGNIYIGNSNDFKLFHNASDNFIRSGTNTNIRIDNNSGVLGARFIPGGASELYNNGTKRIETTSSGVDVAGSLTLTGNIVMSSAASGQGIDFSASGDGASASSELFDDYEEGTYVPTDVSGQSISLTINSTTTYTKIGRLVHVVFDVSWPGGFSGSGNAAISIPFALGVNYGSGVVGWNQVAKPLQCHVNSSGIQMMHNDSGGAKHLSNNDVSGNRLIGAATYFTGT